MSKTVAGIVMLCGPVVAIASSTVGHAVSDAFPSPSQDWISDLAGYAGMVGVLVGAGMFFYGAMMFARK